MTRLRDELDQDQRIAHHDAGQRDHADHRGGGEHHRVGRPGHDALAELIHQPEAGHDADDRQRNGRHDDQGQGRRSRLQAQHEENGHQREGEREAHVAEHPHGDAPFAFAGPGDADTLWQAPGVAAARAPGNCVRASRGTVSRPGSASSSDSERSALRSAMTSAGVRPEISAVTYTTGRRSLR
jgi:hypothetical protein